MSAFFGKSVSLLIAAMALVAVSACNSSSSSSGTSSSSGAGASTGAAYSPTVYDLSTGDVLTNIGGDMYIDPTTGNVLDNVGGDTYVDTTTGGIQYGDSFSGASASKDTDLQQANLQQANVSSRAQLVANRFQMSLQASTQLVQLSDQVKQMTVQGQQMTAQDRVAVTNAGLAIAGVTADQVNQAIQQGYNGDDRAAEALLAKAANHLGMPSAANLRDQLLPALGIQVQ